MLSHFVVEFNSCEHLVRPIASMRKNAFFTGSDRDGQTWAVTASLMETCKLKGVNPQANLCDVISRIVGGRRQSRLDETLPWS